MRFIWLIIEFLKLEIWFEQPRNKLERSGTLENKKICAPRTHSNLLTPKKNDDETKTQKAAVLLKSKITRHDGDQKNVVADFKELLLFDWKSFQAFVIFVRYRGRGPIGSTAKLEVGPLMNYHPREVQLPSGGRHRQSQRKCVVFDDMLYWPISMSPWPAKSTRIMRRPRIRDFTKWAACIMFYAFTACIKSWPSTCR